MKQFMTVNEVAETLALHRETILRMIRRKELDYIRSGGKYLVSVESLIAWVEERKNKRFKKIGKNLKGVGE